MAPTQNTSPSGFPALKGHSYMRLTTYRKSGQGVATPVWFAEGEGRLYFLTDHNAGKLKRIRNNPKVTLAPCSVAGKVLGPSADGVARILEGEEESAAKQALRKKYGLLKMGVDLMGRIFRLGWRYFEIKPEST